MVVYSPENRKCLHFHPRFSPQPLRRVWKTTFTRTLQDTSVASWFPWRRLTLRSHVHAKSRFFIILTDGSIKSCSLCACREVVKKVQLTWPKFWKMPRWVGLERSLISQTLFAPACHSQFCLESTTATYWANFVSEWCQISNFRKKRNQVQVKASLTTAFIWTLTSSCVLV